MNSSRAILLWALGASCVLGWLTQSISKGSADAAESLPIKNLQTGLGRGISVAALGGYRSLAANMVWVEMYSDWRYRRKNEVLQGIELAVALNPDLLFFWLDGSRIIANDMPVWEVGDEDMETLFNSESGIATRKRYARAALAFLDKAPPHLNQEIAMIKERGVIHWQRLDDLDSAISCFQTALELPAAPPYLHRVTAELMVKKGDLAGALDLLKRHYSTLADDDPRALKPIVAQRIAELSALLARGSEDKSALPEP